MSNISENRLTKFLNSDDAAAPVLMVLGLIVLTYCFLLDTSVHGIENIGKLHRQSNGINLGIGVCIIATLLHIARQIKVK